MRRDVCGSCRSSDVHQVLDLGDSPLADDFPFSAADALAQRRYPLVLLRCASCTLLQLSEVVSDDELWGGDYGFYTGSSWVAVQAQWAQARGLLHRYKELTKGLVVEVACNDGSMLSQFAEAGCRTLCVDPAVGPAAKAQDAGLDVIVEGFGLEVAERIVATHGHASLIVANNVIAHVANLDNFLAGLALLLAPEGRLVVEFQYEVDLVAGNMLDHVYHEHRFFFSMTSLDQALRRHGLEALQVLQTEAQGGSLRVHIGHAGSESEDSSVMTLLSEEAWLRDDHSLDGFQGRANRIRTRLRDMLWEQKKAKRNIVGYGASAKSTTLLNFCNIGPDLITYFDDPMPLKHGRFTPGTGIPIFKQPPAGTPDPDVFLCTIWNYIGPIMRREEKFHGQWIVPIPLPILL